MNKKYLLACGDSFTEGHIQGKDASWATYVGPKLGLETINIALGGMSNDWIANTTLTWLMKNKEKAKDCVVMIGWSDFGRQHAIFQPVVEGKFPNTRWNATISPADFSPNFVDLDDPQVPQALREICINRDALIPWFGSFVDCLHKTYRSILFVKEYCESNNIPYMFFDMIDNQKGIFTERNEYDGDPYNNVKVKNRAIPLDTGEVLYFELGRVHDECVDLLNPKMTEYLWDKHYFDIDGNSVLGYIESNPEITGGGHGHGKYMKGNGGHLNIKGAQWFSDIVVKWFHDIY